LQSPFNQGFWLFVFKFIPYVVFFELPVYTLVLLGIFRYAIRTSCVLPESQPYHPGVSCIVTCYSEGTDVRLTIKSLTEQLYDGFIEVICVVDGAAQNLATYEAARSMEPYVRGKRGRSLKVVPKWQRGGRVSSLNAGLSIARGEVVMAMDGDTSFDNAMVASGVRHFADGNVVGVAGCLRVRNVGRSIWSRLQAMEYLLSIHASKVGLSEFNVVNNISGAFGIFRRSFIQPMGGWDSGTAEDLDMTMRLKNYFGRHRRLRILFEPQAMGHTDVPETLKGFMKQRLRWDGDLFYLYIRKHRHSLRPGLFGWRNWLMTLWTGLFFQLVMPFVILVYTVFTLAFFPLGFSLGVWALVYLFYLAVTMIFYSVYLVFLSERPREDLRLAPLLPVVPLFTFFTRLWSGVATLREIAFKSHLDSAMAPWYVLRKTKF
jgi:cellulose synthase/poly-beta-1,6-N-acetylglucosamine synthase-like glycosyltransferase